jgi:hypothetical protein
VTIAEFYEILDASHVTLSDYSDEVGFVMLQAKLLAVRDAMDAVTNAVIRATREQAALRHASHQAKAQYRVTGDATFKDLAATQERAAEEWRAALSAGRLRRDTLFDAASDIRLYARMLEKTIADPGGAARPSVSAVPARQAPTRGGAVVLAPVDDAPELEFRS